MAEAAVTRLKILCIHGYRQNAQTFRERTGAFRKITKKHADLVFITAPNVVPPMETEDGEQPDTTPDQRGWWFSRENDYFKAHDQTDCSKGYDKSLKVIEDAIKEEGPFDGILGFSQGASMVSLICGLQQQDPEKPFKFDFAIFVAGFKSRSSGHNALYEQPIELPTLHVYGDTDKVIQKVTRATKSTEIADFVIRRFYTEMSEELVTYFSQVTTLTHPGGHFIPASGPQKKVYIDFLQKMAQRKAQAS